MLTIGAFLLTIGAVLLTVRISLTCSGKVRLMSTYTDCK